MALDNDIFPIAPFIIIQTITSVSVTPATASLKIAQVIRTPILCTKTAVGNYILYDATGMEKRFTNNEETFICIDEQNVLLIFPSILP